MFEPTRQTREKGFPKRFSYEVLDEFPDEFLHEFPHEFPHEFLHELPQGNATLLKSLSG